MPATLVTQGFVDRSNEKSRTSYYVEDIDDLTGAAAAADAIHDGMGVLTLCNFTKQQAVYLMQEDAEILPASNFAQREIGLKISYVDTVTDDRYTMTVPGPDLSVLGQPGTDVVDIAGNAVMLAFIVIFELNAVSENENPIEVVGARIVGRNN